MILCRFADQTAVQLPPERRLIGMNFCSCCVNHPSDGFTLIHKGRNRTFMNGALSRCLQITVKKLAFLTFHLFLFSSCYRNAFLLPKSSILKNSLHFTVWYYYSWESCKLASRSEKDRRG